MDSCVYLGENQFSKRVNVTIYLVVGLVFISNGVISLSKGPKGFELIYGVVMIVAGILYPLFMYFNFTDNSKFGKWVRVTEQAVLFKNKFFQPAVVIEIAHIRKIRFKAYTVIFNVGQREISFSYKAAPEASKSVKAMLVELAQRKNISLQPG